MGVLSWWWEAHWWGTQREGPEGVLSWWLALSSAQSLLLSTVEPFCFSATIAKLMFPLWATCSENYIFKRVNLQLFVSNVFVCGWRSLSVQNIHSISSKSSLTSLTLLERPAQALLGLQLKRFPMQVVSCHEIRRHTGAPKNALIFQSVDGELSSSSITFCSAETGLRSISPFFKPQHFNLWDGQSLLWCFSLQ